MNLGEYNSFDGNEIDGDGPIVNGDNNRGLDIFLRGSLGAEWGERERREISPIARETPTTVSIFRLLAATTKRNYVVLLVVFLCFVFPRRNRA